VHFQGWEEQAAAGKWVGRRLPPASAPASCAASTSAWRCAGPKKAGTATTQSSTAAPSLAASVIRRA